MSVATSTHMLKGLGLTASVLWCPTCQAPHPTALVGREYRCSVCGKVAGYVPGDDDPVDTLQEGEDDVMPDT